jgi:hypothetical protein
LPDGFSGRCCRFGTKIEPFFTARSEMTGFRSPFAAEISHKSRIRRRRPIRSGTIRYCCRIATDRRVSSAATGVGAAPVQSWRGGRRRSICAKPRLSFNNPPGPQSSHASNNPDLIKLFRNMLAAAPDSPL